MNNSKTSLFREAFEMLQSSAAFLLCLLAPAVLFSGYQAFDQTRMISDLDIMKNEIEINYAPLDWKKSHLDWDLDREINLAREKILAAGHLSPRQYQQIIRDLFNSFQDLHAGVNFYSTEFAFLPFLVQGADNRYFVVWVDDDWADEYNISLQIGDEILSFDGRPLADIIHEIQESAYGAFEKETYRRLSELQLTIREGSALQNVPQGTLKIVYKKNNKVKTDSFLAEWQYAPEEIDNAFSLRPEPSQINLLGKHPFFHKCRALPMYTRWLKHLPKSMRGSEFLGDKKSPFPAFGPVSWKSDSKIFDAYVFSLKGKNIGYVRIPDFYAEAEEVEEFRKIIAVMEGRTRALIIDVMNNPGGYAFYTYALASMLADKPLKNLPEQMSITQEDVYFALQDAEWFADVDSDDDAIDILGKDINGYPVDKKLAISILNFAHFIQQQFKDGKFITDSYPLEGLDYIHPHPKTRYTKPILVLANSLSISCGDFLPALLQDNKRAKVLGSQTAGAGGYILTKKYSNRFGVADFTLTGSIMYRLDGNPLENLGVTPDFPYEFTSQDYTHNYEDFIKFVNNVLIDLK